MSGEDARKTFFNEKRLSFVEGYQLFMGGVSHILELHISPFYLKKLLKGPDLKDTKMEAEIEENGAFIKRLLKIFRRDRLQDGKSSSSHKFGSR